VGTGARGPRLHPLVEPGLAERQVRGVWTHRLNGAERADVIQVRLKISPGEALIAPLALAGQADLTSGVESDDVDLVMRIPPRPDGRDTLRQLPGRAGHAHPLATHRLERQAEILGQSHQDVIGHGVDVAELDDALRRLDEMVAGQARPEPTLRRLGYSEGMRIQRIR